MSRWPTRPLGELISLEYGKALKEQDRVSSGRVAVYGSNGIVGFHDEALVAHSTIVLGRKGAIGEAHLAENGCWPIDTAFYVVPRQPNTISLRYLLLWFTRVDLKRLAITSTIPGLNRNNLYTLPVPVPPLAEQERLVRILDEADALRKLRAQADQRTATLIPALFHEVFSDPDQSVARWASASFADVSSFVTSGSRGWAAYYADSGSRFIRVQNLTGHRLSLHDSAFVRPPDTAEACRTKVQPNDLLLAITGNTIGLSALAPPDVGDAYVSQHVAIIRPNERVCPVFLATFVAMPTGGQRLIAELRYGHTKPGVSLEQVRSMRLPLPPLPLQREFAARVAEVRAMEAAQAESRRHLDALFQSLLHRAFAGEL